MAAGKTRRRRCIQRIQQLACAAQAESILAVVSSQTGPERRVTHSLAVAIEVVPALDVDHLVIALRAVVVDRPVEVGLGALRRAPVVEQVARQEIGRGLLGEGLTGLVAADDGIEPLVSSLVGNEVGQIPEPPSVWATTKNG
jgi:hypothetical protein